MAGNTISTYALFQSTLNDIGKAIGDLQKAQLQLSSGQKSQDFTGIADQAEQFLSIGGVLSKTDQYINDNSIALTRINSTAAVLDQSIESGRALQNLISQRRTGVANNAAFALQVEGLWKQLVGQLNTTVNNQYLFSGTRTQVPAVDAENFPSLQEPGVPDAGYYRGSAQDLTMRPQDNTEITYNVRADASGFQKIFAALAVAVEGDADNSDEKLAQAYTLAQEGVEEVINLQAGVNANKVLVETISNELRGTKLYWKSIQESIGNTDVVTVSTQVAINQGILQGAFQAFAKISALRLSDYLR